MAEALDVETEIQSFTTEIEKAHKVRRALVKLKHRLETKLRIPSSVTFKEYENFATVVQPKNDFLSVAIAALRAKNDLCLNTCGIKCVDADKEQMRFELSFGVGSRIYSGYEVQLNVENEGFRLTKYKLPEGLNVTTIIDKKPMKEFLDVLQLLHNIYTYGNALFHRKEQVEMLIEYCTYKNLDVNVFSSLDQKYIEISFKSDILRLKSKAEKITFILKYANETHLPVHAFYEKEHVNKEDQVHLERYILDFGTYSLTEAFRSITHKKSTQESSFGTENNEELVLSQRLKDIHTISKSTLIRASRILNESVAASRSNSASPRRTATHAQKMQEEVVESRPKSLSPRRKSTHAQEMLEEEVESRPKDLSPRRKSIRAQKIPEKEKVESRPLNISPRRMSARAQKMPEKENIESSLMNTSPRRMSARAHKMPEKENIESRPMNTSPKRMPARVQEMPEEEVESRPKHLSLRHKSTHAQKIPEEEKIESRSMNLSPRHKSIRAQKVPDKEKVESMPLNISPRRMSVRPQKVSEKENIESRPMNISPRHMPARVREMPEEEIHSTPVHLLPRHKSSRAQKILEEENVETRPMNLSPRHLSTREQKIAAENMGIKPMTLFREDMKKKETNRKLVYFPKSSTPLRNFAGEQQEQLTRYLEIDDLSSISTSDVNVENTPQENQNVPPVASSTPSLHHNMRRKNEAESVLLKRKDDIHAQRNSPQIHKDKYHQTRLHNFLKVGENQERNNSNRTSPRKVISFSEELKINSQTSTNLATVNLLQTSVPRVLLHNIMAEMEKSENRVEEEDIDDSEQNDDEGDEDEMEQREKEKKKKSSVHVHKGTPVPRGFRSSRMKKTNKRQSVVSGKRLKNSNLGLEKWY